MELSTVWFLIISFLWVGYFVLEGFDFGVGMLIGVLGRDDRERRVVLNTIGPHFDANEVWVITAGGAMFAAFPEWYATVFSGFYLPLLLILLALIVRLVGIDYRSKRRELSWRRRWDLAIMISSLVPAFGWGLAFGNIVAGVPVGPDKEFVGTLGDLLGPFPLLAGLVTVSLFLTHGAIFVALKTAGDVRARAAALAGRIGPVAAVSAACWISWLALRQNSSAVWVLGVSALGVLIAALVANRRGREGWAFTGTAGTVGLLMITVFTSLFPALLPSTLNPAWDLTTQNASSTGYTLTIMTWAAAVITPFVLAYQAWSYWVFRRRLRVDLIPDDAVASARS